MSEENIERIYKTLLEESTEFKPDENSKASKFYLNILREYFLQDELEEFNEFHKTLENFESKIIKYINYDYRNGLYFYYWNLNNINFDIQLKKNHLIVSFDNGYKIKSATIKNKWSEILKTVLTKSYSINLNQFKDIEQPILDYFENKYKCDIIYCSESNKYESYWIHKYMDT